ncbi:uncharacterized protein [Chelonus insularis]|uniref:uncharacterized protein n=1 Tax=Chelonus insularis TaxID=460826 RepID=UPI00158E5277|nr:uncharacterized protein LOC118074139 [Chelonus insularis]
MRLIIVFFFCHNFIKASDYINCTGCPYHNVSLAAYYPDYSSDNSLDYLDMRGKKLNTLQDFIDGREAYVTAAMDLIPDVPYGTKICSPELNEHFGMHIPIQVRDYNNDLKGNGFSRLDLCVRSESDSYDVAVNKIITIYI